MPFARDFFFSEQQEEILKVIEEAEMHTSSEIQLYIDSRNIENELLEAQKLFYNLGMNKTQKRNAVLFYLNVHCKRFAIVGDEAVDRLLPEGFWDMIKNQCIEYFKKGAFLEGICWGILKCGKDLSFYFPPSDENKNELPNQIHKN